MGSSQEIVSSLPDETPFIKQPMQRSIIRNRLKGSTRKYPIIYVQGEINEQQQKVLVSQFYQMVDENKTWPAVLCFVKANTDLSETISDIEKQLSGIRGSQRMRALITLGDNIKEGIEAIQREICLPA